MNKPNSFAALKRYLVDNPYLRFEHPGMGKTPPVTEGRKFIRVQAGQPVYLTDTGKETYGEKSAKDYEFFEDRFEIKFPEDWTDMKDKRLKYYYLDSPYQNKE